MTQRSNSRTFLLVYLGVLSAFGPFVMDMYLSSFPALAQFFDASSSMVQLSLTASTVGLAAGQLLFGALSDKYGRRTPLLAAMTLFLASTAGCLLSPSITAFITFRFVQGLAAAGSVVISRSVAADRYTGGRLADMLAMIGMINGCATIVSPMCGGFMAECGGWQGIFLFLLVFGVALTGGTLHLEESLPAASRQAVRWGDMFRNFGKVLRNRQYVYYIAQYGFAMGMLFVNMASAPFIMQQHYGLTLTEFSLVFGVNAVALAVASGAAAKFPTMRRALHAADAGMLLFAAVLCIAVWFGCGFWIYEAIIFGLYLAMGVVFTASNALAMDSERRNAGVASALLGASGYVAGGIVSPLVGLGDIMTTTAVLFLAGASCSWLCARRMERDGRPSDPRPLPHDCLNVRHTDRIGRSTNA